MCQVLGAPEHNHPLTMTVKSQTSLRPTISTIFSLGRSVNLCTSKRNTEDLTEFNMQQSRLEGLIQVIEDWHAKACLLGVKIYSVHST